MLRKLRIRNFQVHRDLEILFDPLITCIVGKSDAGKSAILRALRWVCLNKPSGDAFLRHGSKAVSVVLHADDHTVVRRRGRGGNSYGLDGHVYQAFGAGTPPEAVANVLNVGEENFAGQHSPAFWLSDTPGQVTRELNRIVSLDLIDSTLGNLAASLRKAKAVVEVSQDRLAEAKQYKADLSWVVATNEQLCRIEQLEQDMQQNRARMAGIASVLEEVREVEESSRDADLRLAVALDAVSVGERIVDGKERIRCLREMLDRIAEEEANVQVAREAAKQAAAELERIGKGRCPQCGQSLLSSSRIST